jgi:GAF domain-containing protein
MADASVHRADVLRAAAQSYAAATADSAAPDLYLPLTFLLTQVRRCLNIDIAFVSRFVDRDRLFEVVSSAGDAAPEVAPGNSDPLLDSYCQRIVDGRLPAVIHDTAAIEEAAALPITAALNIKAYLSAPVVLANGVVFGTVCCISHSTRPDLRESDAAALRAVADAVASSVDRKGTVRFSAWQPRGQ